MNKFSVHVAINGIILASHLYCRLCSSETSYYSGPIYVYRPAIHRLSNSQGVCWGQLGIPCMQTH